MIGEIIQRDARKAGLIKGRFDETWFSVPDCQAL